jgi:hypothetical protein
LPRIQIKKDTVLKTDILTVIIGLVEFLVADPEVPGSIPRLYQIF